MSIENRKNYNEIEKNILFQQVHGLCPLCQKPLYYEKNGKIEKLYELAHIYPLNPSPEVERLLEDEPKLFINSCNELDNIIPLCANCHTMQDKPMTIESYRILYKIKLHLVENEKVINMYASYPMEEELVEIVEKMCSYDVNYDGKLEYNLMNIDTKIPDERVLNNKVKFDVSQYYLLLKKLFADNNKSKPNSFELIANQVKSFYLSISGVCKNKNDIYNHIATWMQGKFNGGSLEAYEIIVSFFIQDCEVFSDVAK